MHSMHKAEGTPSPRAISFSVENAVCKDSHRRQCRCNRLLRSQKNAVSILVGLQLVELQLVGHCIQKLQFDQKKCSVHFLNAVSDLLALVVADEGDDNFGRACGQRGKALS